jgi:hypothetical protein
VPFCAAGAQGILLVIGLDTDDLLGVLPPSVLAALVACFCAALSLKHPACNNEAFLHDSVSH